LIIPIKRMDESEVDPLKIPLNPDGTMKMTQDGDIDFSGEEKQGPLREFPFTEKRVWNLGIALAARQLQLDLDHAKILKDKIVLHGPNSLTRTIPLDPAGFFYIDWSIRYSDLKGGRTPIYYGHLSELLMNDYVRTHKGEEPADKFKDKIVLIGSVATGNNVADEGATPLEARTRLVTKHLNIANSVLTGRFVKRTNLPTEIALIIALGCVSGMLTWRLRVLVASIAVTGLTIAYVMFITWAYINQRYWVPMVMPVAGGLLLPHFSLVTYRVIFEQKEQRRVRGIFSKIVSPDVVQELLSVEKLSLVGARRKVTVFFADVRGFTEFTDATQEAAEDHVRKNKLNETEATAYFDRTAADTVAIVNMYLATIADTVKTHNGTLDKYMGDCVMAFWGAPVENEHHARDCVSAAITAQRAVYALNQQRFQENEKRKKENETLVASGKDPLPLLPLLSLGTGINTGYVTVGLMGSDATIVNYTVFGREVNLASRLEGASGRGRIFIGESTYLELKRDAPELAASCIPQNPITPKGFRQAIPIYEVQWKECADSAASPPRDVQAAA
jgi:adenylate cyclase